MKLSKDKFLKLKRKYSRKPENSLCTDFSALIYILIYLQVHSPAPWYITLLTAKDGASLHMPALTSFWSLERSHPGRNGIC